LKYSSNWNFYFLYFFNEKKTFNSSNRNSSKMRWIMLSFELVGHDDFVQPDEWVAYENAKMKY